MRTRHISLSFYGWAVTEECRLFTVLEKRLSSVERPGLAIHMAVPSPAAPIGTVGFVRRDEEGYFGNGIIDSG